MKNDTHEDQLTRHHKIPHSRGGSSDPSNIKVIARRLHRAWHYLFRYPDGVTNMTPLEAARQVREWATADLSDFAHALPPRKRLAWCVVFGEGTTPFEALRIIEDEWT